MGNDNASGNSLIQNYLALMRWDKPVGTWLLFWPCSWSITLAATEQNMAILPTLNLLALFFLGALAMRSAGCVINDWWDRDLDAQVERTRNRPLASGAISSKQALFLLAGLLGSALVILLQLRIEVFYWALASLPLVILYPLMKRITWWPQAFLGLTFNFGALMGWVAVTGEIALPALLLYASGFFWTLGYDTIYAFQDRKEDEAVGVKSTARKLYRIAKPVISFFYFASILLYVGALMAVSTPFIYYGLLLIPLGIVVMLLKQLNPDDADLCARQFRKSSWLGFWLLVPIAACFLL